MLKKRLIPKLLVVRQDVAGRSRPVVVTTRLFRRGALVGDPVSQAKIYEAQIADELMVLNVDGLPYSRESDVLSMIERLATETFMPVTVGGGVRGVDDCGRLLQRGADKVAMNTAAFRTPDLISRAAHRFGSQCVVVSIDFRTDSSGRPVVATDRASLLTDRNVDDWAGKAASLGAGEILLCDADRDGTGSGLNIDVGRRVAASVTVPVILSGGCGNADHFVRGFVDGRADAVAAGTFFALHDQNVMQVRAQVRNAGVPIRTQT